MKKYLYLMPIILWASSSSFAAQSNSVQVQPLAIAPQNNLLGLSNITVHYYQTMLGGIQPVCPAGEGLVVPSIKYDSTSLMTAFDCIRPYTISMAQSSTFQTELRGWYSVTEPGPLKIFGQVVSTTRYSTMVDPVELGTTFHIGMTPIYSYYKDSSGKMSSSPAYYYSWATGWITIKSVTPGITYDVTSPTASAIPPGYGFTLDFQAPDLLPGKYEVTAVIRGYSWHSGCRSTLSLDPRYAFQTVDIKCNCVSILGMAGLRTEPDYWCGDNQLSLTIM